MATTQTPILAPLLHYLLIQLLLLPYQQHILTLAAPGGGKWNLLLSNIGVSAMHMQLLNTDRVIIFDLPTPSDLSTCSLMSGAPPAPSCLMAFNANWVVVRNYPTIPGGDPRSYPSSGSAVLLPLRTCRVERMLPLKFWSVVVHQKDLLLVQIMKTLLGPLTPVRGFELVTQIHSTAGWDLGRNPVLTPLIYRPNNPTGLRFEAQNSSSIPRMYHSTAILLRDGRILVSGSNPHAYYNFTGVVFPTDLTMEAFSPDYLDPRLIRVRPMIVSPTSHSQIGYGQQLVINFKAQGRINRGFITVTMVAPPFTTHSFSMNQRLLVLTNSTGISASVTSLGGSNYQVRVMTPGSNILAPPGYYLLFVVYREVPSQGIWVQIK
ncbi:UNVERIFIED_CONTAM: Aldehyde oxidase GLOX1 [Sesamum latifolium]|uniref:Aldehyde oxidase GLOX1 n=1 Tax=Sesamum latifolium TaxID=2727402 RepID=A0AAW2WC18_9LAMI